MEREVFYQGNGAVGNGYYCRGLDGLFGRIEGLRVARTRGGGFRHSNDRALPGAGCLC